MRNIIKQLLLATIIAFTLSSPTNADANTKFSGFALGDNIEDTVTYCQNNLKYVFGVEQVKENMFLVVCYPALDVKDKAYPILTRGKPEEISILVVGNKIVGIHLIFTSKSTYQKVLADFLNSDIIKEEPVTEHESWGPRFTNVKENWHGWNYTNTNANNPKEKIYVIHVEMIVGNH